MVLKKEWEPVETKPPIPNPFKYYLFIDKKDV
jgi:hypothetical protein